MSPPVKEVLVPCKVEIRYTRPLFDSMKYISSSDEAVAMLRDIIQFEQIDFKEYFWVILLNEGNRVLGISRIGEGTRNMVAVSVQEIVQLALLSHAGAVIVMHNHPSGKLIFSRFDDLITNEITKALRLFDLNLLDHILITSESHHSMADEGRLPY
ncbi:MAG: JAB domain-containing protein [Crocinitomicaceae bacterium]